MKSSAITPRNAVQILNEIHKQKAEKPLLIGRRQEIDRLFGSVGRWFIDLFGPVVGDRFLLEWVRSGNTFYIVQCDLDADHPNGKDPRQLPLDYATPTKTRLPELIRTPEEVDIQRWDKLRILGEFTIDGTRPLQQLFFLPLTDAERCLSDAANRSKLAKELEDLFDSLAIIRTSRLADTEKTLNLDHTHCINPSAAIDWMAHQISLHKEHRRSLTEYAFVFHRFIASRVGAWALYDPESPYVQVHANWGLPDALQFYPYDAWDVHVVTEEITAYPSYKSHFLWPKADGDWTFLPVKNSVARHQCLRTGEIIDIAKGTVDIGKKLGRRVAVMWFAGVETPSGEQVCLPWYRTFEYADPDLSADLSSTHLIVPVRTESDLAKVDTLALEINKKWDIAIELQPSEALVRNGTFREKILESARRFDSPVLYAGSPLSHAYYLLTQSYGKIVIKSHRRSFRKRAYIKYHKLVRDGIPRKIAAKNERVVFAKLDRSQIIELLAAKLIEEVIELATAQDSDARIEELADAYEVLRGIMHQFSVDELAVLQAAEQKRQKVGGFEEGMFLLETSLPKPGEPTAEQREVSFKDFISPEFGPSSVRLPFSLMTRLARVGSRYLPIPGTDLSLKISSRQDGIEISVQRQEISDFLRIRVG